VLFVGRFGISATAGSLRSSVFPGSFLLDLIKVLLQLFDLVFDFSQTHALGAYQDLVRALATVVIPAGTLDIYVGDGAMRHLAWPGSQKEKVKRVSGHKYLQSGERLLLLE